MDDRMKGEAAGIFFLGYVLLQIPGGYLAGTLERRKIHQPVPDCPGAFARSAAGWSRSFRQFEVMRFLLGVAESGVFPATLVLLANWFPRAGTRPGQRLLEPLPAAGRRRVGALHRLAAGWLWLADDADPGRHPAVPLAAGLVVLHPATIRGTRSGFRPRKRSFLKPPCSAKRRNWSRRKRFPLAAPSCNRRFWSCWRCVSCTTPRPTAAYLPHGRHQGRRHDFTGLKPACSSPCLTWSPPWSWCCSRGTRIKPASAGAMPPSFMP